MKRILATAAMAVTALLGTGCTTANAAWPNHAALTAEQANYEVEHCAGNPVAGICRNQKLLAQASQVVFADTADNSHVKAICAAHSLNTHQWRMGFCRDFIYPYHLGQSAVAHDLATDGVLSRAAVMHGIYPDVPFHV